MNGYILTTIQNTHGWVVYENDISTDYQFFSREILLPLPPFFFIAFQKKHI